MIEEIRELFQNFIAPQLEGIRGDIRAIAADIRAVDVKVESYRREVLSEIRRVEEVLSADFVRLEEKVDLKLANFDTKLSAMSDSMNERFSTMNERLAMMSEKMELHRRELLAEVRAALK